MQKEQFTGKHLLVGLTYLNKDESLKEQIQLHGYISKISDNTVVFKRADNNEEYSIPFNESNMIPAEPDAVYELKSTGEAVESVDFLSSWTIHAPKEDENL